MRVLSFVSASATRRIRSYVEQDHAVRELPLRDLETEFSRAGPKVVVIDPAMMRPDAFLRLVEAARRERNVAVIVHTTLTEQIAVVVGRGATELPLEIVPCGADGESALFSKAIMRSLEPSVSALVLHGVLQVLSDARPEVVARIVALFATEHVPTSVQGMLRHSERSVHWMRQKLASGGVRHARRLRWGALLSRAHSLLRSGRDSRIAAALDRHDLAPARTLRRACVALVGVSLQQAAALREDEFAARIVRAVTEARPTPTQ